MTEVIDLPNDLLAEKSLLGCLLVEGQAFDDISDLSLASENFYNPQYGIVFQAIKDVYFNAQPVDYVTVSSRLSEVGKLELIGGQSSLIELFSDQASSANVYHYGKIVKDKFNLRELIKTALRVADMGRSFHGKSEDFISEVEAAFFKITNTAKSSAMIKLNEVLKENLRDLNDPTKKAGEITGLPTGYTHLDKLLLGMQPGQLIVLAARPAMGKTALALNVALNTCLRSGLPIALFSLEMISSELSMRLLSCRSKVDSKRMRTKNFYEQDLNNIGNAVRELSSLPIMINDSGDVTVLDIQSQCRKIKTEQGLGLVIIDYLQLMKSHSNNPSREQQISEISRALKNMAKELKCPVIALSQLNRQVESRPNKRPNTADLRESGAIEQDADVVMFVYRDEVYNPDTPDKGVAEIIVGKNRAGEIGTVKLAWVGAHTSFENLAHDQ